MTFNDLNRLGKSRTPFFFYTDFKGEHLFCSPLDEMDRYDIEFSFDADQRTPSDEQRLPCTPIPYSSYLEKFKQVIEKIKSGDTYLLNLTQPTPIRTDASLKEIYKKAHARFKLRVGERFVCFSPERFVKIVGNRIYTFPMKGTIDATLPNAEEKILNDSKEIAEHVMVVDLLRNDLGIVADDIRVDSFRYVEKIRAGEKELLQVSSKISGHVGREWESRIGDILKQLLPAGSISGTPKKSTVKIIEEVEGYARGYFTGIFGLYDGERLDTAIMIRFIEKTEEGHLYKSGGGITLDSEPRREYQEMIDKIYIP